MKEFIVVPGAVVKFFIAAVILTLLWPSISMAQNVVSWKALIEELKVNNPNLIAMGRRVQSLEELPEAKMAWADPMISVGLMNLPVDSFELDQEGMTQKVIGVGQRIPSLKKRVADRGLAESDVKVAGAKKDLITAKMIAQLRKIVNEIIFTQRALLILSDNELIIDEFIRIANAKYSVGKGVQVNVIQAQVERSKLIDKRLSLTERLKLAKIRANTLLGREPGGDFKTPEPYTVPDKNVSIENLWERAALDSPSILLARAVFSHSLSRKEQAEGLTGMNITISSQYGRRENGAMRRPDFLSLKAAVTVPLWRSTKQDKIIASSRIGVQEKAAALENTILIIKSELSLAVTSFHKETNTIELYETGFIPQAAQALKSALVAYQLDKVDFLTLLSNEISLLRFELGLEESILRKRNLSAKIAALTGADLTSGGVDERN